ncbi:hypothetical protein LINPERHAP2_LOCUS28899 [Linum perenne]
MCSQLVEPIRRHCRRHTPSRPSRLSTTRPCAPCQPVVTSWWLSRLLSTGRRPSRKLIVAPFFNLPSPLLSTTVSMSLRR